jgi:trehalose-phosphatase
MTGAALAEVVGRLFHGRTSALILDFDGTLAPIAPRPEEARLDGLVRSTLERLAGVPGLHVGVVSGRSLEGLAQAGGRVRGVRVAVNGGLRMRDDGHDWTHPGALAAGPELEGLARRLAGPMRALAGTLLEPKGVTLALHYRGAPHHADALGRLLAEELNRCSIPLRVVHGKAVYEVQPDVGWDKGRACDALCESWGVADAAAYLGDDEIDEPAFVSVRRRGGVACHVGDRSGPTHADHVIPSVDEAHAFLRALADRMGAPG